MNKQGKVLCVMQCCVFYMFSPQTPYTTWKMLEAFGKQMLCFENGWNKYKMFENCWTFVDVVFYFLENVWTMLENCCLCLLTNRNVWKIN